MSPRPDESVDRLADVVELRPCQARLGLLALSVLLRPPVEAIRCPGLVGQAAAAEFGYARLVGRPVLETRQ